MGTRGFRIIRFRGRYWVFYNHWDSYPKGLGRWLVDSIPTDPEQYQDWLQYQRDNYTKWDSLLHQLLTVQPEDMRKLLLDGYHTPVFYATFDDRLHANAPPYYASGFNDGHIEWTYTIDLDREVFSVDNRAHFNLNQIPANKSWIEALSEDMRGNRFLLPQLVPAESVAALVLDPPSSAISTAYARLHTRLVNPKNLDHFPPSHLVEPRLRWELFNIFQESQQADLSVSLLGWQAQDLPFRELAFFILCLATGGKHLALWDHRRVKTPYSEALYLGLPSNETSEVDIELATCLGVGYHMAGLPMGSAPGQTKYWLEGALICLVPRLDYPGILEQAVADAIEYGRARCITSSFNAVLISIEHLVLIRSFQNGTVDHTELLPLVLITDHTSKYPQTRYGDRVLETFYAGWYGGTKTEENGEVKQVKQVNRVAPLPVKRVSTRNTFIALVLFMETTTLESLRPTQPNEARLPDEICEMVLRNVSDIRTYNSCLRVSRRFRFVCQQRPVVVDNIVFLEPSPKNPASSSSPEKKTHNRQPPSEFLAVEMSSGRRMEVRLRSDSEGVDELICFVVAGNEWNKKTFAKYCITFQGLRLPIAGADEAGNREPRTDQDGYGRSRQPAMYDSKGSPWEAPLAVCNISMGSTTKRLAEFWRQAAEQFNIPLSEPDGPAWTFPPNTFWYFGKIYASRDGPDDKPSDGLDDLKTFYYLYLRVKRAGKYCDTQWDDIIREAAENLNQTSTKVAEQRSCPDDDVVGADEPYVILTVGLEVRLFQWLQSFDPSRDDKARRKMSPSSLLRELTQGKVLSLCARGDREQIGRFLERAQRHGEAIKARGLEKCGGTRKWH